MYGDQYIELHNGAGLEVYLECVKPRKDNFKKMQNNRNTLGTQGGYSGFQVTGRFEWGHKFKNPKNKTLKKSPEPK